ncbi:hypothetical protein KLVA111870_21740 [Klebsiella variicola]
MVVHYERGAEDIQYEKGGFLLRKIGVTCLEEIFIM